MFQTFTYVDVFLEKWDQTEETCIFTLNYAEYYWIFI